MCTGISLSGSSSQARTSGMVGFGSVMLSALGPHLAHSPISVKAAHGRLPHHLLHYCNQCRKLWGSTRLVLILEDRFTIELTCTSLDECMKSPSLSLKLKRQQWTSSYTSLLWQSNLVLTCKRANKEANAACWYSV
jgi:hypothetical protein